MVEIDLKIKDMSQLFVRI